MCYDDNGGDGGMKKEMNLVQVIFFLILGTLMQIWETYSKLNPPYFPFCMLSQLMAQPTFHFLQKPGQLPI